MPQPYPHSFPTSVQINHKSSSSPDIPLEVVPLVHLPVRRKTCVSCQNFTLSLSKINFIILPQVSSTFWHFCPLSLYHSSHSNLKHHFFLFFLFHVQSPISLLQNVLWTVYSFFFCRPLRFHTSAESPFAYENWSHSYLSLWRLTQFGCHTGQCERKASEWYLAPELLSAYSLSLPVVGLYMTNPYSGPQDVRKIHPHAHSAARKFFWLRFSCFLLLLPVFLCNINGKILKIWSIGIWVPEQWCRRAKYECWFMSTFSSWMSPTSFKISYL